MNTFKAVKFYFEDLGFEVEEMQMNEPSVGINEGWVVFRCKNENNQKWKEVTWDDAVWHTEKKSNKYELLKDSFINQELN
jgi:hypothetical protein